MDNEIALTPAVCCDRILLQSVMKPKPGKSTVKFLEQALTQTVQFLTLESYGQTQPCEVI